MIESSGKVKGERGKERVGAAHLERFVRLGKLDLCGGSTAGAV